MNTIDHLTMAVELPLKTFVKIQLGEKVKIQPRILL